jgi:hypothetical protein
MGLDELGRRRWQKPRKRLVFGKDTVPKSQSSLFDVAERKKQEGMEAAYRHAVTPWRQAFMDRLREVAQSQQYLTSEEIVVWLENKGIVTGENRAAGSLMQAAARTGMIVHDSWRDSRRPECHKAPVRQWKSLIYKEEKNGKR